MDERRVVGRGGRAKVGRFSRAGMALTGRYLVPQALHREGVREERGTALILLAGHRRLPAGRVIAEES